MRKKRDYRYRNENGKLVAGPASVLHQIYNAKGSLQEYNDWIGEEYIKAFIQQMSDKINDDLVVETRRSQLKLVG